MLSETLSEEYQNSFYDKKREVFNIKDGNTLAAVLNHHRAICFCDIHLLENTLWSRP